eukprot:Nitzschia sp. Nitz4//scaffold5_size260463//91278//94320//NITZ4_000970-RA/size260463-augustus-gene-0.8-mRNA-1//1//CDS//3329555304//1025//frame0
MKSFMRCQVVVFTLLFGLGKATLRSPETQTAGNSVGTDTQRDLAVYALYNVPPFAVTFQTQHTAALETALQQLQNGTSTTRTSANTNGVLISETNGKDSSLSYPIRTITQSFLLEQLASKISTFKSQTRQGIDTGAEWNSIYQLLSEIDLKAHMYLVEGTTLEEESNTRRNLGSKQQRRQLTSYITLRTEFYGSLVFEEPDDAATKPANDEVRSLFGDWIDEIFDDDRDQYFRELVQSDQDLLREMTYVRVETNIDESSAGQSTNLVGWSQRTEKVLLALLILTGVMGLSWMGLYLQQRRKHRSKAREFVEEQDLKLDVHPNRPPSVKEAGRSSSMDSVRHGNDVFHRNSVSGAMSVLEDTDKYLSKHRPDLYDQNGSNNASFNMFGGDYNIPANPFEFIYSAFSAPAPNTSLEPSPQGAFTPRATALASPAYGHRPSLDFEAENIAASSNFDHYNDSEAPDDERMDQEHAAMFSPRLSGAGHWADSGGYRPISSIWRNIANMWDNDPYRPQSSNDGLVIGSPHSITNENGMEMQTIPLEPYRDDAANYDFAFQDFPRHDGTPCLIFNESAYQRNSMASFDAGSTLSDLDDSQDMEPAQTTPLSDEDFQRMLAQHNHYNPDTNSSFDDSIFSDEQTGQVQDVTPSSLLNEAKSPAFKDKLGRLMQQKHRHYEKKTIVEKHQERRAKERKHQRDQERRDKHKVLARNIEDIEAAFASPLAGAPARNRDFAHPQSPKVDSSRWSSAQYSPNPNRGRYSPKPSSQGAQSYSNGFSPYRPSSRRGRSGSLSNQEEPSSFRPLARHGSSMSSSRNSSPQSEASVSEKSGHPTNLYVDTRHTLSLRTGSASASSLPGAMDSSDLDKLSMPQMTIDGNEKYPSPSSVMDELIGVPTSISPIPQKTFSLTESLSKPDSFSEI